MAEELTKPEIRAKFAGLEEEGDKGDMHEDVAKQNDKDIRAICPL